MAAASLGEHEQALQWLQDLEKATPELRDFVWALRARNLRSLAQWDKAQSLWHNLHQQEPHSPWCKEALYGIADALFAKDDWRQAYYAYERAVRMYGNSEQAPMAKFNMAHCLAMRGQRQQANKLYKQLLTHTSSDFLQSLVKQQIQALDQTTAAKEDLHLHMVDQWLSSRRLNEAQEALNTLMHDPNTRTPPALLQSRWGLLAYRQRDFKSAIEHFNQAIAQNHHGTSADLLQQLANAYAADAQYDSAIALWRNIANQNSHNRRGREALARAGGLAAYAQQFELANSLFKQFLQRYPRDRNADEVMWGMGWNAYRAAHLPEAQHILKLLQKRHPHSALTDRLNYWQGRIAADLGQWDAAITAYEKVAMHTASYYGMIARHRLDELKMMLGPSQQVTTSPLYASLQTLFLPPSPARQESPTSVSLGSLWAPGLPTLWGDNVFVWQSKQGQRLLQLLRLGQYPAAIAQVPRVPTLPNFHARQIAYSKARLIAALGDEAQALQIMSPHINSHLKNLPQGELRHYFELVYPNAKATWVHASAHEFGISAWLVLALMRQESRFVEKAHSAASAHGLMQIIPATGKRIAEHLQIADFTPETLNNPATSIRFGSWYIAQLLKKFHGNLALAICSYNAGPKAVQGWVDVGAGRDLDAFIEDIPFRETRHYVKEVLANLAMYQTLYEAKPLILPHSIEASYDDNIGF